MPEDQQTGGGDGARDLSSPRCNLGPIVPLPYGMLIGLIFNLWNASGPKHINLNPHDRHRRLSSLGCSWVLLHCHDEWKAETSAQSMVIRTKVLKAKMNESKKKTVVVYCEKRLLILNTSGISSGKICPIIFQIHLYNP